ncbi:hypothetical protein RI129_002030 [Pyrocoelia pectoralis]
MKNYDQLALKTFIRGLQGRIQDMIRLRNPDSLEQAISYVLEEENFMHYQRQNNHSYNSSNLLHSKPNFPKPQNNYFKPNNFHNSSFSNPRYGNFNSSFPSQPINIQPNQNVAPKQYFTNQQVFEKPRNVFQPSNRTFSRPEHMTTSSRNANFPTPMSISTRNTNFSKPQHPNQLYNFEENKFTCQHDEQVAGPSRIESQQELNSNENFREVDLNNPIT